MIGTLDNFGFVLLKLNLVGFLVSNSRILPNRRSVQVHITVVDKLTVEAIGTVIAELQQYICDFAPLVMM